MMIKFKEHNHTGNGFSLSAANKFSGKTNPKSVS